MNLGHRQLPKQPSVVQLFVAYVPSPSMGPNDSLLVNRVSQNKYKTVTSVLLVEGMLASRLAFFEEATCYVAEVTC